MMWTKWKQHLESLGGDELSLNTSKKGGKKSDADIVKAGRCILKFEKGRGPWENGDSVPFLGRGVPVK